MFPYALITTPSRPLTMGPKALISKPSSRRLLGLSASRLQLLNSNIEKTIPKYFIILFFIIINLKSNF